MLKYMFLVHVLLLAGLFTAKVTQFVCTSKPPHDCNDHACTIVNAALHDIGLNFDSNVCHSFHHVNCALHTLVNDEQICGSDGVTYGSHCQFAVARCISLGNHVHGVVTPLTIVNHGPCGSLAQTSVPVATGSASSAPVSTTSAAASPLTSTSLQSMTTTPVSSTATAPAASTTPAAPISTTISTHNILGSVFCQYQTSISCGPVFAVVCGSNGKFYPNKCELLKEQCLDPTLRETADTSHCTLGP